MKKLLLVLLLACVACFFVFSFAVSEEQEGETKADTTKKEAPKADTTKKEAPKADTTKADTTVVVYKYVGNSKCKTCHNTEKRGMIHDSWAKTKHATAYATLANEESQKIAKEKGIKDAQADAKCLKCHVTGYGQPTGDKYSVEEGVGCEACHGAAEGYVMKHATNKKLAMELGLVEPDEKLCVACHNEESPTYQEFVFKEAYKLIEHHAPEPEK
jgi:hypothetical protein